MLLYEKNTFEENLIYDIKHIYNFIYLFIYSRLESAMFSNFEVVIKDFFSLLILIIIRKIINSSRFFH